MVWCTPARRAVRRFQPQSNKLVQLVSQGISIPGINNIDPGQDTPELKSLVLRLASDVAVGIFQHCDSEGQVNSSLAPPLLYVLDTRVEGLQRIVNLTLNSSVKAWTPFVGSVKKGFPDCSKSVLGNEPTLSLWPGEAVLLGISMLAPLSLSSASTAEGEISQLQMRWATARNGAHG